MMLHPHDRAKLDNTDDASFYDLPRFVTHVDDGFIQTLTQLYRDRLTPNTRILDLMSSWVSHLPDITFAHVEGHGLNELELARNPRLDHYFVQNLNQNPQLPLADATFDAVLCAVSVQYLQYPEAIFSELARILKPDGLAIISFSNRMFFQKAIQAWREGSDTDRIQLVKAYFQATPQFSEPEVISQAAPATALSWLGLGDRDPFYAVIAHRLAATSRTDPSQASPLNSANSLD